MHYANTSPHPCETMRPRYKHSTITHPRNLGEKVTVRSKVKCWCSTPRQGTACTERLESNPTYDTLQRQRVRSNISAGLKPCLFVHRPEILLRRAKMKRNRTLLLRRPRNIQSNQVYRSNQDDQGGYRQTERDYEQMSAAPPPTEHLVSPNGEEGIVRFERSAASSKDLEGADTAPQHPRKFGTDPPLNASPALTTMDHSIWCFGFFIVPVQDSSRTKRRRQKMMSQRTREQQGCTRYQGLAEKDNRRNRMMSRTAAFPDTRSRKETQKDEETLC